MVEDRIIKRIEGIEKIEVKKKEKRIEKIIEVNVDKIEEIEKIEDEGRIGMNIRRMRNGVKKVEGIVIDKEIGIKNEDKI